MPLIEKRFVTPSLTWAALDNQQNDKPLLLALHGWLDNSHSFLPIADALGEHFHLVALDLPGHGFSDHKPGYYHFVDWVGDLAELIQTQGWQGCHLMGHSLGALISCAYAGVFAQNISSLILLEGAGPLTLPADETREHMRKAFTQRFRPSRPPSPVDLEQAVKARCAISDLAPHTARLILERNFDAQSSLWRTDPMLRRLSPLRIGEPQAENLVRGISAPTLLLLAEQGMEHLKSQITVRQDWFDDLYLDYLPGGHHFHMEHPERTADVILGFLSQQLSHS